MARVPDLAPEQMNPAQRQLHDEIAAKRRGHVRGPFAIWLRNPTLGDRANKLGNALRADGKLEKRLFELMVLVIARHYSAQYEWFAHADQARNAGVAHETVEALRAGRMPDYARDDERLIDELTRGVLAGGVLDAGLYQRALDALGLDLLIEVVAAIGFYAMVAMTLNTFDAPVPDGTQPLPLVPDGTQQLSIG